MSYEVGAFGDDSIKCLPFIVERLNSMPKFEATKVAKILHGYNLYAFHISKIPDRRIRESLLRLEKEIHLKKIERLMVEERLKQRLRNFVTTKTRIILRDPSDV